MYFGWLEWTLNHNKQTPLSNPLRERWISAWFMSFVMITHWWFGVFSPLHGFFFLFCFSQRYETLLKDMEKKSEEQREVLISLQQEFKKAQGLSAGKAWPDPGIRWSRDPHAPDSLTTDQSCEFPTLDWIKLTCVFLLVANKFVFHVGSFCVRFFFFICLYRNRT